MLLDCSTGKGRRSSSLPLPNPQKVELPRRSSYEDVLRKAKEIYFGEKANLDNMSMCDSSGLTIKLDDTSTWNLMILNLAVTNFT